MPFDTRRTALAEREEQKERRRLWKADLQRLKLFIAIEANSGMAVLTEGVLPMLPASLTVRRFSPELAPLLIAAAMPVLRPNPHAEAFLKLLLEEINKSSRRK